MMKADDAVKKETGYIAIAVLAMSVLMQAVFLFLEKWSTAVLFGNILSGAAAVMNFFLMGITVQAAVSEEDEKAAQNKIRLSQLLRMLMLFIVAFLGVTVKIFNAAAVLIPLFFPRVAIALRPLFDRIRG